MLRGKHRASPPPGAQTQRGIDNSKQTPLRISKRGYENLSALKNVSFLMFAFLVALVIKHEDYDIRSVKGVNVMSTSVIKNIVAVSGGF